MAITNNSKTARKPLTKKGASTKAPSSNSSSAGKEQVQPNPYDGHRIIKKYPNSELIPNAQKRLKVLESIKP